MEVPSHFLWLFACLGDFVLLSKVFINDFPMETSIDTFYYRGYIHSYPTKLDYNELFIKKSWIIIELSMNYHELSIENSWIIIPCPMNILIFHWYPMDPRGAQTNRPEIRVAAVDVGSVPQGAWAVIYVSHGIIRNYV